MNDILRSVLSNVTTQVWSAFLLLFILTAILHLVFVWPFNRFSKTGWKRFDYLWLSLAALGLFSATKTVNSWIAPAKASGLQYHLDYTYELLMNQVPINGYGYFCMPFQRLKSSPPDYDRRVALFDSACDWTKKLNIALVQDTTKFKVIDTTNLPILETTDNQILFTKRNIYALIHDYNKTLIEINDLNESAKESESDRLLKFLTPLILIFGIAIRITKTSGEIALESS